MDKEKIEQAVTLFLEGIGDDINREGIQETPALKKISHFILFVSIIYCRFMARYTLDIFLMARWLG